MKYQNINFNEYELEQLCEIHDQCIIAYYESDEPLMTDEKFDDLEFHLKSMGFDISNVGTESTKYKSKFERKFKMFSLNKFQIKEETMTDDQAKELFDKYGSGILSWKYDGLAIEIFYKDGHLTKISTRGDGMVGRDVTDKLKNSVPQIITTNKSEIYFRCECVMSNHNFGKYFSDKYSNPRNLASGIIGDENLEDKRVKYLDLIVHEYLDENGHPYPSHDKTAERHFNTKVFWVIDSWEKLKDIYNLVQPLRPEYTYPTDGLVYTSNDYYGEVISNNGKYPKKATSIKFKPPRLISEVVDVTWELKRGGMYFPTIHYNPVYFDGRFMKKASGYNYKYIIENDLCKGKKVEITISNDLIPQVKPYIE